MGRDSRRRVYRNVRRSLERDALLASAGEQLAAGIDAYLTNGDRAALEAALQRYREAAAQASGPTST